MTLLYRLAENGAATAAALAIEVNQPSAAVLATLQKLKKDRTVEPLVAGLWCVTAEYHKTKMRS
jgi:hypothetical protein